MDEVKLKKAFLKIKTQMNQLESKIDKLDSIKNSYFELYDGVENNYQLILDIQKKEQASISFDSIQNELEDLKKEQEELKILFEKSLETFLDSPKKNLVSKEEVSEISELFQESLNEQTNSLKLDLTNEISKVYDTFYNEILDLKKELNKSNSNIVKTSSNKKTKLNKNNSLSHKSDKVNEKENYNEKSESKVKKAIKWLFVDEEEEDLDSIKNQVNTNKKK